MLTRLWQWLGAAVLLVGLTSMPAFAQNAERQAVRHAAGSARCATAADGACASQPTTDPANAARLAALQDACDRQDASSCYALGMAYRKGIGVQSNRPIARILFTEACTADRGAACTELAWLTPSSEAADLAQRFALFGKGCALGDRPACIELAGALLDGLGAAPDPVRGKALLAAACADGAEDACSDLADRLRSGSGLERDGDAAAILSDAQCRRGYARGCLDAEYAITSSQGDPALAADYLRLGCDAASADACGRLGTWRLRGSGVPQDRAAALALFGRACELRKDFCSEAEDIRGEPALIAACDRGDAASCTRLGALYWYGGAALGDPVKGAARYAQACEGGDAAACVEAAGKLDRHAKNAPQRALAYLQRACDGAVKDACLTLAEELEDGKLVPPDPPRAGALYARLCGQGEKRACDAQDRLAVQFPELPIPEVDARFLPPLDPPTPAASSTLPEPRVQRAAAKCEVHVAAFRGAVYEDRSCIPVEMSIGGYAVKPGKAPWQALIARPPQIGSRTLTAPERVLCGGSLVAKGWIVTAAHCLSQDKLDFDNAGYTVRLGVYRSHEAEGLSYRVLRSVAFPGYSRSDPTKAYDIALVQYDYRNPQQLGPVQSIRTIRLDPVPVGKRLIADRMPVYSYGWGWTAVTNSQTSNELRGVKMQLMSEPACTRLTGFVGARSNVALCAGGPGGEQACFGDSGGPLVYFGDVGAVPTLIGVVSAGRKCGTTGEASRYTRISSVLDWIQATIAPAHTP